MSSLSCKPHAQGKYLKLQDEDWARGINGPIFSRTLCGGANASGTLFKWDELPSRQREKLVQSATPIPWQALVQEEEVSSPWPHHPAGLNRTLPPPDPSTLYDENGNLFKSAFTRQLEEEHWRMKKSMTSLSMTTSIGKPPGFHRPNPMEFTRKSLKTLPQHDTLRLLQRDLRKVIVDGSRIESKEDKKIRRLLMEDFSSLLRGGDLRSPSRLKRLKRISRLSSKKEEDEKQTEVQKKPEDAARRVTATLVFPARPPKTAPPTHSLTFLPEESRQQLIDQLKDEWEGHNRMLQRYSLSLNYLDSISRVRKREEAEHNMKLIEDKIKLLSHQNIIIHDQPPSVRTRTRTRMRS
ncbi:hypothetical protein GUITHDRAFT_100459 [Guillardia theta CCMP2712]|uniref:Enkurin domain-containing protein n=1 Tax=Guillardia theta (strain CCMP2712) TaxID=905079 RepID=L1K027_GUITC|nr:hypothetical protein GUITHDRAFT_100459 [Guillardia theta CCMP2712]EKX54211.1 hypothetical protein GUITHDRAFT_100459 [Guillardia theta CCMP2712]|eukprot:XP_005841191.1 hypothetical protein GUITHDRAFT_100459 [Guillardia theta CCMP2712]